MESGYSQFSTMKKIRVAFCEFSRSCHLDSISHAFTKCVILYTVRLADIGDYKKSSSNVAEKTTKDVVATQSWYRKFF